MDAQFSRTKQIREYFSWLRQVRDDHTLPDGAFNVAFTIGEHINRETGSAWPSTTRIAELVGRDQSTVLRSVRRLEKAGHIAIEPGKQGRGHAHRYRLVLKAPSVAAPDADPKYAPAHIYDQGKYANGDLKYAPEGSKICASAYEPTYNHLKNHEESAHARASGVQEKILNLKGWEAAQINKLLARVDREQTKANPNETIYEKVERLQRIKDRKPGSISASIDLDRAWLEAALAGLAHVPTPAEALNGAKPCWLDNGGPVIDHHPLGLSSIAMSS
jgi:DNA-binding MarR family transcriptional regulator